MHRPLFLTLVVSALFGFTLSAQDVNHLNKLRLAQEFENAGMWERAVGLYEELHRAELSNFVFFDGLQRGYRQLKEYDKAIALTQDRLQLQPDDPVLLSAVAGLLYDAGRESAADSVWDSILANSDSNVSVYQFVAMGMLDRRLYDKAIRTYLAGRAAGKVKELFANELANIYAALQQYSEATTEYVRRIRASPEQLPFIESQVAAFISRPSALQQTIAVVSAEVERSPNNVSLRRLLAWLRAEGREYNAAVREYQVIDELTGARGSELFSYAQRLLQEHADAAAAEAFRSIVQRSTNPSLVPQARFGFARAMEALSADSSRPSPSIASSRSTESQPTSAGALRLYEGIVADYPGTDLAAQSLFRIGLLRYERFFDLTGALSAFEQVRSSPRGASLRLDAILKMGDVEVVRNDLPRARVNYAEVAGQSNLPYQDQAVFRLAELDYFEGRFDSSLVKLGRFKTVVTGDLANDALALQYFIEENAAGAPNALASFAAADLLLRQRKQSEGLARFMDIVSAFPHALLVDDALMKVGDIHVSLRHPDEAITAFRTVADSLPASIWKDRAQFRIGDILERLRKDPVRAIAAFEQLLVKYPTSLFADEARRRIRVLRGDRVP